MPPPPLRHSVSPATHLSLERAEFVTTDEPISVHRGPPRSAASGRLLAGLDTRGCEGCEMSGVHGDSMTQSRSLP